jgi:1-acyl-sn-glycerol-3-phosphate acyltransferase
MYENRGGIKMKGGEDGARDHHGELLPVLSSSSAKMDYEKLVNTPLPKFDEAYPGSPFFMEFGYFCLRRTYKSIFRTFEVTGAEKIPTDRGSMCCAWHTNGLVDPISILLTHPKMFVIGGRHDLVTRPILGFWARKPVVRKAELLRGGCSEEQAERLNGRSLLNLATGISHGFACALFPEGTSHSESHLIRIKTGPFRTVLAAAAHAKAIDAQTPVLIPVGLHFRKRHLFRTDCWVEYGDSIELPRDKLSEELVQTVKNGDWMEPPSELVLALRDTLEEKLTPMTPNRDSHSEVFRDGVIAHAQSRIERGTELTWREEVLAIRALKAKNTTPEVKEIATKIGDALHSADLDGRDINSKCDGLRGVSAKGALTDISKLIPMLILLPTIIVGLGPQLAAGRLLGDNTDEGLDARSSYHFLFGMFGSLFWWPILSTIITILSINYSSELNSELGLEWMALIGDQAWQQTISVISLWAALILLFWISGVSFARGWDPISDSAKWFRRRKNNSKVSKNLVKLRELLK